MSVLLIAGIGVFVAGLVAIAFGIPVKEFSFGDTLIVAGAVVSCTGLIMVSLSVVVRELRKLAEAMRSGAAAAGRGDDLREDAPRVSVQPIPRPDVANSSPQMSNADQAALAAASRQRPAAPVPLPRWQADMFSHDRASAVTGAVPDQASAELPASSDKPPPKQRRNLLFASLRKDRGRASAVTFDDAWPQPDRAQAASDPHGDSHDRNASAATVLKSGVVDGMAYSLYSDGSIEAQLPEGTRRFESIDRLRAYLDQQT